jgi:catechol 2,3-dioxygenase-like lactoylglutathione lyase family enzyme
MQPKTISIRPFIGAKDFANSRAFYRDLGFKEAELGNNMSVFEAEGLSFYLQDAYVKDWVDNTMIFLEVAYVNQYYNQIAALNLPQKYPTVKLSPPIKLEWGSECFLHDPSGILWHIGEFNQK